MSACLSTGDRGRVLPHDCTAAARVPGVHSICSGPPDAPSSGERHDRGVCPRAVSDNCFEEAVQPSQADLRRHLQQHRQRRRRFRGPRRPPPPHPSKIPFAWSTVAQRHSQWQWNSKVAEDYIFAGACKSFAGWMHRAVRRSFNLVCLVPGGAGTVR